MRTHNGHKSVNDDGREAPRESQEINRLLASAVIILGVLCIVLFASMFRTNQGTSEACQERLEGQTVKLLEPGGAPVTGRARPPGAPLPATTK